MQQYSHRNPWPKGVRALLACIGAIAFGAAPSVAARDYFVDPTGADGAFRTVYSAVEAVAGQTETDRANIFIAPGRYLERVTVRKPFVTFIGQGQSAAEVTIVFNAPIIHEPFYDLGATLAIWPEATAFMARNLTFENSIPSSSSAKGVALGCYADRTIFDGVRVLGHQDALLVDGRARHYFRESFIAGDTDFIFGDATAVFERCTIQSRGHGYITAADTARDIANGLIFLDCTLANGTAPSQSVVLGRPWFWAPAQQMPSVIFIRTRIGTHIARVGWDPWDYLLNPSIDRDPYTRVSEWGSMDLAGHLLLDSNQDGTPDGRVRWADPMTAEQAANYTVENIFGPVEFWNVATQPETSDRPYTRQGEPWNPHQQLLWLPAQPGTHPQLLNISTRFRVGGGQTVGIGGFIVTGSAPKKV
ncbi:MAG TPA: pectinesterase family protein, partial [Chthoniobacterales bacterium]